MVKQFRATVVHAEPVWLNADETIEKSVALIEEAAENGAQIVVFPEIWIPGYPWWLWLGSPAWGMQFVERYHENSLQVDDPRFQRIADTARSDGSDLAVHELNVGRGGALCCWEHLQPLTKYAMYSMHEQVHIASWSSFSIYHAIAERPIN